MALMLAAGFSDAARHKQSISNAWEIGKPIFVRLPLAIVAASFLGQLLPQELIGSLLGESTGVAGVLVAVVIGGLLPGGPLITFPIVTAIYSAGAGAPQIVALLTAWSIFALHRVITFELPGMGPRFVAFRLIVTAILPVLAGLLAALLPKALY
ncbi:MAG: hypothetical protein WD489_01005 [Rhodovibrionaceae bacterium]